MYKPTSTYRIQFHQKFTFKDLAKQIPYLVALGIDTIYASPIFTALKGSTHGYDGVNPLAINPELGTEEELIALSEELRSKGIGWLQDIVPNHMAFSTQNEWLMDVLQRWEDSPYFNFFDIGMVNAQDDQRLMVPFLDANLTQVIEEGRLGLVWHNGELYLAHGEQRWPTNQLTAAVLPSAPINEEMLTTINNDKKLLMEIAQVQFYRLCHWEETTQQINYRRFFTVNALICLQMQRPEVFDAYHAYILELIQKNVFQGLRIDHVDGLADPKGYCQMLSAKVGPEVYIVVEKILADGEKLPLDWPVAGTTGYDFLATVNNLLTNCSAKKKLTKRYKESIGKSLKASALLIEKKQEILEEHMQGELDHLLALFFSLGLASKDLATSSLQQAIADVMIHCPVYRFYLNAHYTEEDGAVALVKLIEKVPQSKQNKLGLSILKQIAAQLSTNDGAAALTFFKRLMQFTGPLMAKGMEDTLMYTYNRFIVHAEVGDAPYAFGMTIKKFHRLMKERFKNNPYALNATATHDTKRGEDVRARLNVLADVPQLWNDLITALEKKYDSVAEFGVHLNDAYLIYQVLFGIWPLTQQSDAELNDRMNSYLEKALREAKKRTTWVSPNEDYEEKVKHFTSELLTADGKGFELINGLVATTADFSVLNSLAQLTLKFTCPGIPDSYQGTELWDLSLVDPDNRRPVDYLLRSNWLNELADETLEQLWKQRKNAKIKLWLSQQLNRIRSTYKLIFTEGAYIPVKVKGIYKKHVIAFLRRTEKEHLLVIVPLGLAAITDINTNIAALDWKDTRLLLPSEHGYEWENLLDKTKGYLDPLAGSISLASMLSKFPIGILHFKLPPKTRAAGVLMPMFSLPGKAGVGQLGSSALAFAKSLAQAGHTYWQLLPLNPVSAMESYSPYSSYSAMAGNTLFIDPEQLVIKGWLLSADLDRLLETSADEVNYKQAEQAQEELLKMAYQNYLQKENHLDEPLLNFIEREAYWLDNFALYSVLRNHHQLLPWKEWPEVYKWREPIAMDQFEKEFNAEIKEVKWQQWVFDQQWHNFRVQLKEIGIMLIGDLPFYVSYDSADVWANPKLFKLDANLEMQVVAGVPPDAFSVDGQCWGLPIFDWEFLQSTDFKWWMDRIKRNLELFELLRLDHFRAFHSYFEIDAKALNAKDGCWVKGSGVALLHKLTEVFGSSSFIAEDLGSDMDGAFELRDQFKLAGMKVLQFAFGPDSAFSIHAPHQILDTNTVVYTGTHDTNTVKGWYRNELTPNSKKRLATYVGRKVNQGKIHQEMIRLALSSTAKLAILQMQDLLGLEAWSRMNSPGTTEKNWLWRMNANEFDEKIIKSLRKQLLAYGRA